MDVYIQRVKTENLPAEAAIAAFVAMNAEEGKAIKVKKSNPVVGPVLVTPHDPAKMLFPAGWYFAKKSLRNKHNSTNGLYHEVNVFKDDVFKHPWETYACEEARQLMSADFSEHLFALVVSSLCAGKLELATTGAGHIMLVQNPEMSRIKDIYILDGWGYKDGAFVNDDGSKVVPVYLR